MGGIDLERLFARGGVKEVNLVPFGQRGQPSLERQNANLSAWAARQVAAGRLIFGLRTQVPTPHLAVLIQRHQLTLGGEGAAGGRDIVPRENRGAAFQQVLVVRPLKAAQIGPEGSGRRGRETRAALFSAV